MLTCSIDLNTPGKHVGYVGLFHSDHRHAHSVIPIPIVVVNGAPGPSALVSAGVHGDEYVGISVARQLIEDIVPADVTGRLIIMPMMNMPAWRVDERVSPLDGGNLNRAFPGRPDGTPTEQIAHFVEHSILKDLDFCLDLHSGGATARYLPSTFIYDRERSRMDEKCRAADAFGAPHCFVVKAGLEAGSLSGACERQEVVCVATELSGGHVLEPDMLAAAKDGTYRLLRHWGLLKAPPTGHATQTHTEFLRLSFGTESAVIAPDDGLVVPTKSLGQRVRAGDTLGKLYPMGNLSAASITLKAPIDGIIATQTTRSQVAPGDFLCLIAQSEERGQLIAKA